MEKVLPREVVVLVGENVREEKGNKISLMGLYVGDDILIHSAEPKVHLPSLSILVIVRDGQGVFESALVLLEPSGKERALGEREVEKVKEQNAIFAVTLNNYLVEEFGDYRVKLRLDEEEYEYTFGIKSSPNEPKE